VLKTVNYQLLQIYTVSPFNLYYVEGTNWL